MLVEEKVLIFPNSESKDFISSSSKDSNISASSSSERTALWLWACSALLASNKARIEATNRPMNILLILHLRGNTKKPNAALERLAHPTTNKNYSPANPL